MRRSSIAAGLSTAAPYSLRATTVPRVSTPVTWGELRGALVTDDATRLRFGPRDVLARVRARGDLFEPVLSTRQRLAGSARVH